MEGVQSSRGIPSNASSSGVDDRTLFPDNGRETLAIAGFWSGRHPQKCCRVLGTCGETRYGGVLGSKIRAWHFQFLQAGGEWGTIRFGCDISGADLFYSGSELDAGFW